MKKDLPLTALVRSFVTMAFLTSSSLGVIADNPRKSATNLQFYTYVSASESRDVGFYTFNSSNPTVLTPRRQRCEVLWRRHLCTGKVLVVVL